MRKIHKRHIDKLCTTTLYVEETENKDIVVPDNKESVNKELITTEQQTALRYQLSLALSNIPDEKTRIRRLVYLFYENVYQCTKGDFNRIQSIVATIHKSSQSMDYEYIEFRTKEFLRDICDIDIK